MINEFNFEQQLITIIQNSNLSLDKIYYILLNKTNEIKAAYYESQANEFANQILKIQQDNLNNSQDQIK